MRLSLMGLLVFGLSVNCLADSFTLTSPEIKQGQALSKAQEFNGFGCNGSNHSPALQWSAVPEGGYSKFSAHCL